jgi:hypothetical protein
MMSDQEFEKLMDKMWPGRPKTEAEKEAWWKAHLAKIRQVAAEGRMR